MRRWLPLILLCLLPTTAWAGPYEFFGTGPRAIAMGGAYAALGEDIAGLYYNIAAIKQVERLHLEAGYVYAAPHYTINGRKHDVDVNRGVTFGGIVSMRIAGHRLSTGLNSFIPDDHVMRFLVLPTDHPHSPLVANANHTLVTIIGGACEVFDWWSIGVGMNVLADNRGGVTLRINENRPSTGSLKSEIGTFFSPVAGMWFHPLPAWRIGLGYREKVEMRLDLPNKISIPPLSAFPANNLTLLRESQLDLYAYTWSHFSPRQFQLGMAVQPWGSLMAAIDVTHMAWSEMRTDAAASYVYLSGGLADVFPTQNGTPPPEPNFHDTWNPALGIEGAVWQGDLLRVNLRGGYRYRPTPVPDQSGVSNYLDSNTHIPSLGVGLTLTHLGELLPRPCSLDAFAQYHQHERRESHKDDPADRVGDLVFKGSWINVGANVTLRF